MIKEIRRELKRQLQEMMQFKFNLFFSNFGGPGGARTLDTLLKRQVL